MFCWYDISIKHCITIFVYSYMCECMDTPTFDFHCDCVFLVVVNTCFCVSIYGAIDVIINATEIPSCIRDGSQIVRIVFRPLSDYTERSLSHAIGSVLMNGRQCSVQDSFYVTLYSCSPPLFRQSITQDIITAVSCSSLLLKHMSHAVTLY